jgi:hypothetical protein
MKSKLDKSVSRKNYQMLNCKENLKISKQELKVSKLEEDLRLAQQK